MTGSSSPDPRYFKDGAGLRPRLRYLFKSPWRYFWFVQPKWLLTWRCRRRDRSAAEAPTGGSTRKEQGE